MVLHTVFASGTAMSAAGTEDTVAASAFSPSGENEIQERSQVGGLPKFIGHHGMCNDLAAVTTATGGAYYRIEMNTWPTAQYIKVPFALQANAETALVGTGAVNGGVHWLQPGIPLDRDADWTLKTMVSATTNSAYVVAFYESYGNPIPMTGPSDTWRLMSASVDGTANTWTSMGTATITDLDPRYKYRVNEMYVASENTSTLGARITSPSNSTYVGAISNSIEAAATNPAPMRVTFPFDSIIVSGVETITGEQLVDGAGKTQIYVGFQRIGATSGAIAPSAPMAPTGGFGGMTNLLSGMMGNR